MNNFWTKIKKPIYTLAPMAGINDIAFRDLCKDFGADVIYSEMASVSALFYSPKKTLEMLISNKKQKPYVIQLFGSNPEYFLKAVNLLTNIKKIKNFGIKNYIIPDGFDINFGCPAQKVLKQKAGAALFQDLKLSKEIIKTVVGSTDLPVSIKIRSAAGKITCFDFLKSINDIKIQAVMIHGRSLKQGFAGDIDLEVIKNIRQYFSGIILANGGLNSLQDIENILNKTKADGVGLARGVLGNPWLFKKQEKEKLSSQDIFKIILEHAELIEKYNLSFVEFRKHLCWYVSGLPGAKKLRECLVKISNKDELYDILKNII